MSKPRAFIVAALVGASLLSACGGSNNPPAASSSPASSRSGSFSAEVATTDLYARTPLRFELGIFQSSGQGVKLVTFGTVGIRFSFQGTGSQTPPAPGPQLTGTYVGAYGTATAGSAPTLSDPSTARGVYQVENVTFDRPGVWQAEVTADVQGVGNQDLTAIFPVGAKPALPAPGQPALRTENLTIASKGAPLSAIDSRAQGGQPIPDPELHRWTIAKAISEHRPALVIFATPVYCTSQFCGPSTDGVEHLAKQYADRAVFIHIEIWHDFNKHEINKAAADWLYRNNDLTEPWLYLIGADGIIKDRWGPLFEMSEVAKDLAQLPPMKS